MRRASLFLFALLAAGCGGAAKHTAPPLPHALAQAWAQRADAIAVAAKIPQELLEPLTSKVNALAGHKPCAPVEREAHDLAAWLRNPSD